MTTHTSQTTRPSCHYCWSEPCLTQEDNGFLWEECAETWHMLSFWFTQYNGAHTCGLWGQQMLTGNSSPSNSAQLDSDSVMKPERRKGFLAQQKKKVLIHKMISWKKVIFVEIWIHYYFYYIKWEKKNDGSGILLQINIFYINFRSMHVID